MSVATIRKERCLLGWTYRRAAYCQAIHSANVQKRLLWAKAHDADPFHDVIWSDETTIQLETLCCRKQGASLQLKPRAKHPTKVQVWGGISWKGPTAICIFSGTMNAELYVEILRRCLLPGAHKRKERLTSVLFLDSSFYYIRGRCGMPCVNIFSK